MQWRDYGFAAVVLAAILPTFIWTTRMLVNRLAAQNQELLRQLIADSTNQSAMFAAALKTFNETTTEEREERMEMVRQFSGANGAMQQVMAAQGEAMRSMTSTLTAVQTTLDRHRNESTQNYLDLRRTMKDLYTALTSEACRGGDPA